MATSGHWTRLRQGLWAGAILTVGAIAGGGIQTTTAQAGTGVVTGRVVWGSVCFTPGVQPAVPGAGTEGAQPGAAAPPALQSDGAAPDSTPPGAPTVIRPVPPRAFPAGAVLVAVQGTNVSARTDENGRFRLERVPAGQYLTVAAGPHAAASNAYALLPNIQLDAGQTRDLGTLSLGSSGPGPCRFVPSAVDSGEGAPTNP